MTRPSTLASFAAKYEVEGTLAEERPVAIPYGDGFLTGSLSLVPNAHEVVLIASDAGCSRHSSAWRELSAAFRRSGFATALVDLVTPEEAADPECAAWTRHRVHELAKRISSARSWLVTRPEVDGFPVVLFGQRTAAAPVLLSAAARTASRR